MGSAAAHQLAARGLSVLGLERFWPAHDQGSGHGETRIVRQSYFEGAAYVPLLRRAYEGWHELQETSGRDILTLCGGLYVGDPESKVFKGSRLAAEAHDLPHEVLDAEQIRARFPAMDPADHALRPLRGQRRLRPPGADDPREPRPRRPARRRAALRRARPVLALDARRRGRGRHRPGHVRRGPARDRRGGLGARAARRPRARPAGRAPGRRLVHARLRRGPVRAVDERGAAGLHRGDRPQPRHLRLPDGRRSRRRDEAGLLQHLRPGRPRHGRPRGHRGRDRGHPHPGARSSSRT